MGLCFNAIGEKKFWSLPFFLHFRSSSIAPVVILIFVAIQIDHIPYVLLRTNLKVFKWHGKSEYCKISAGFPTDGTEDKLTFGQVKLAFIITYDVESCSAAPEMSSQPFLNSLLFPPFRARIENHFDPVVLISFNWGTSLTLSLSIRI